MGCGLSRSKKQLHPCLLVGMVINGKPVASFNRRVIAFRAETGYVEEGSIRAVRSAKGKITGVEKLGRITVPVREQYSSVQDWVKTALKESGGSVSDIHIFEVIREMLANYTTPSYGELVELEVFRAYIIKRMEDTVF